MMVTRGEGGLEESEMVSDENYSFGGEHTIMHTVIKI